MGLPLKDHVLDYRGRVEAVSIDDLNRVARHLDSGDAVIVVVGDAGRLTTPLEKLRPVSIPAAADASNMGGGELVFH
jgi:hypothetical protein